MKRFLQRWRAFYLTRRFFIALAGVILLLLGSYFLPALQVAANAGIWVLLVLTVMDAWALFKQGDGLTGDRVVPDRLSNGDDNPVSITVLSRYAFPVSLEIIDERPLQFQFREPGFRHSLKPGGELSMEYTVHPVERGLYGFGRLNVYAASPLGLVRRRYRLAEDVDRPVYPSFLRLRHYELMAASNRLHEVGVKRIRRIGQAMEFEQIREYVTGDDPRRVNWPATARRGDLMVNQYQDERAQPLYCLIDMGRVMKMPFDGMSLLDYSINTSLVLSSVALNRQDRAGLITFSRQVENHVRAEKGMRQLGVLMESLYALTTDFAESDFERLYVDVRRRLPHRSLLILYTNFESMTALARQLPYLRALNRVHLLVVVFFENTELLTLRTRKPADTESIYIRTIAEQFAREKEEVVRELGRYGIQSILSTPHNLSIDTLNKYLELKARGMF